MLVKKEDGTLYDTHETYNSDREEEIASIGDEIIEEFEEQFVEETHITTYTDNSWECCPAGTYIDTCDTPDYEELMESVIEEHITKDMSDDFIEDLKEYVKDNARSEETLTDRAIENYEPPEPDYDDYGD